MAGQVLIESAGTAVPAYRYQLKAEIHGAGFMTVREFSTVARIDETELSRVVNGWVFPSSGTQQKMATALG